MRKEREWNHRPAKARRFSRGTGLTYPEKIDKLNMSSEQKPQKPGDCFILKEGRSKGVFGETRFERRDWRDEIRDS